MKYHLILLFFATLNTCNQVSKDAIAQDTMAASNQIDGTYHLETLENTPVVDTTLSIHFDATAKRITGFSGCNRFSASYTLKGDAISMGPLASTKRSCGDLANQLEFDIYEALSKTNQLIVTDGVLQFLSGEKVMLTARQKESHLVFNYSASTRGRFLGIHVNDSIIVVTQDRDTKPFSKPIQKAAWHQLVSLMQDINLDSIAHLKSPTEARFYDGASIGVLEIVQNGTVYKSSSFDHGTPPSEIQALVDALVSLSESVE